MLKVSIFAEQVHPVFQEDRKQLQRIDFHVAVDIWHQFTPADLLHILLAIITDLCFLCVC